MIVYILQERLSDGWENRLASIDDMLLEEILSAFPVLQLRIQQMEVIENGHTTKTETCQ
jgi:hypothetical protein